MKTTVLTLTFLLALCTIVPSINAENQDIQTLENGYDVRQIYSSSGQDDVAIGDFDSSNPGNEIAICIQSYKVAEVYHDGTGWKSRIIYQGASSFEIFTEIAVGDVNASHSGDEVVVTTTNLRMNATMIWGSGTSWHAKEIFNDVKAIHSIEIGEINSTCPGEEIVVSGSSKNITLLQNSGTGINKQIIYSDMSAVNYNDMAIGEFDSAHTGNEIIAVSTNSSVELYYDTGSWKYQILPKGKNCVAIGDFDSSNAGNEIVTVQSGIEVWEVYGSGSSWNSRKLWTDTSIIDSIAIGEFNSSNPGNEVVVGGQSKKVTMITGSGTSWVATTLYTNPTPSLDTFYGLGVGEVDPTHTGNEIITCTASGKTLEIGEGKFVPETGIILIPIVATVALFILLTYRRKAG